MNRSLIKKVMNREIEKSQLIQTTFQKFENWELQQVSKWGKQKILYKKLNSQQSEFQEFRCMGPSQSFQNISTFDTYHTLVQRHSKSFYFGPQIQIYKNKFNPKQQLVKHTFKFNDHKEMQHFVTQIKKIIDTKANNVPFNILYPINVFLKEENSLINNIKTSCSDKPNEVMVIHKWLGKSLYDLVKQKNSPLNEKLVWFILNDLSKSLEILEEKNHASHYLVPQNIWYNQNDNWFLYDGNYVIGNEQIDAFYQKKIKLKELISEDFRKKIETNAIITNHQAIQEDIFCLGYSLIFMMTGVHSKQLPQKDNQRETCVNDMLQRITQVQPSTLGTQTDRLKVLQNDFKLYKYSSELISFVKNLIKSDPKRRYSIRHIRSYLKTKQQEIFMNEEQQWSRITISKEQKTSNDSKNQTSYKFRKTNQMRSPQREYDSKLLPENFQSNQPNTTSMRTLKKQHLKQKFVVINHNNLPRFSFSLSENQETRNSMFQEGQTTPIRRMEESKLGNFIDSKKVSSATFRAEIFLPDPHQNVVNKKMENIRRINSPGLQENHVTFASPQKYSTSSINPVSTMESFPPQSLTSHNFLKTHIQSSSQMVFKSPPHHTYQSPVKVKLNYFSPQKTYF